MRVNVIIISILMLNIAFSQDKQEARANPFIGKWNLKNYIYDNETMPIENRKKKDYIQLEADNSFTEIKDGIFNKGFWEFAPFGEVLLFYSLDTNFYIPFKVIEVTESILKLRLTDWKTLDLIIVWEKDKNSN